MSSYTGKRTNSSDSESVRVMVVLRLHDIHVKNMHDFMHGIETWLGFTTERAVQVFPVQSCSFGHIGYTVFFNQVAKSLNKHARVFVVKTVAQKVVDFFLGLHEIKGIVWMCFFAHRLFLQVLQDFFGFIDVFLLGAFVASVNQEYQFSVSDSEVHPIAFGDEDAHFEHFIPDVLNIAQVTEAGADYPAFNRTDSLPVFELRHPFEKGVGSSDFVFHMGSVAPTLQKGNVAQCSSGEATGVVDC